MVKIWLKEMRADFLVLSVVLVMIGGAAADYDGSFSWTLFLLTMIGVVAAHISVNLFNEYSDWRTGIDSRTEKTPFSGGSGTLQAGLIQPLQVKVAAWSALAVSFVIGIYLASQAGWPVLVLMTIGGVVAVKYTDYLTRWMIGEIASGVTLGSFVVLGTYFVQTGTFSTGIVWASIPPGILTCELLFLNEFPDTEADRAGGRRHMVIVLGKRLSAVVYTLFLAAMYAVIVAGTAAGHLPRQTLISLVTIPLALFASVRAFTAPDDLRRLVPALAANVILVLATDFLLALGFFMA